MLTLFVTPVFYLYMESFRAWVGRLSRHRERAAAQPQHAGAPASTPAAPPASAPAGPTTWQPIPARE
jgi:hypothetical protein